MLVVWLGVLGLFVPRLPRPQEGGRGRGVADANAAVAVGVQLLPLVTGRGGVEVVVTAGQSGQAGQRPGRLSAGRTSNTFKKLVNYSTFQFFCRNISCYFSVVFKALKFKLNTCNLLKQCMLNIKDL